MSPIILLLSSIMVFIPFVLNNSDSGRTFAFQKQSRSFHRSRHRKLPSCPLPVSLQKENFIRHRRAKFLVEQARNCLRSKIQTPLTLVDFLFLSAGFQVFMNSIWRLFCNYFWILNQSLSMNHLNLQLHGVLSPSQ
jgi:hypothetical protein